MTSKVAQHAAILGLSGRITFADVKTAYRREMLKWHPDLHHGKETASLADTRAREINAAYEFLSEITEDHVIPAVDSPSTRAHDEYRTRHTYQKRGFNPGFPDPAVFEVFVKSSMIVSAGYDVGRRLLYLKFQSGSIYRYFSVLQAVFDELLRAESVGRYVNAKILHRFKYESC
jgi:KTSC domain/DnaJ domain